MRFGYVVRSNSRAFASNTSPKFIDRESLEKCRTGNIVSIRGNINPELRPDWSSLYNMGQIKTKPPPGWFKSYFPTGIHPFYMGVLSSKAKLTTVLCSNKAFSLTWPASMPIYWNKRERLHKRRQV